MGPRRTRRRICHVWCAAFRHAERRSVRHPERGGARRWLPPSAAGVAGRGSVILCPSASRATAARLREPKKADPSSPHARRRHACGPAGVDGHRRHRPPRRHPVARELRRRGPCRRRRRGMFDRLTLIVDPETTGHTTPAAPGIRHPDMPVSGPHEASARERLRRWSPRAAAQPPRQAPQAGCLHKSYLCRCTFRAHIGRNVHSAR